MNERTARRLVLPTTGYDIPDFEEGLGVRDPLLHHADPAASSTLPTRM